MSHRDQDQDQVRVGNLAQDITRRIIVELHMEAGDQHKERLNERGQRRPLTISYCSLSVFQLHLFTSVEDRFSQESLCPDYPS
jgi:hypothetical protein